jgi:NAD(P)H-hydrate epimerase
MHSLVLMENAGRGCADVLCREGIHGPVVICCGKGNNGGDGLVIARHLELRGYAVHVVIYGSVEELSEDAAVNHAILQKAGIPVTVCDSPTETPPAPLHSADWVVDALLGTGVRGDPRPPLDLAIGHLNQTAARRLAVDLPSGLDCDRGTPGSPTVRADWTCTFVGRKRGFKNPAASEYLGRVEVLDIGTPRAVLEEALAKDSP